ncbi:hypothetical protein JCM11641_002112 [Rhodosporidiobolus odoratus]
MEPPDDLSDSEYTSTASTGVPAPTVEPKLVQSTLTTIFHPTPPSVYLPQLNPQQREAVTASRQGGLAVHAGPGSGKTKVLTTRVAWLIQEAKIKPEELVVVTFTNKAANEMKVRLSKIVGAEVVDKVVMGTFHSVCVRYLRKYAKLVGMVSHFLISDRDDCLAIIKRLLLSSTVPPSLKREMKPNQFLEIISRCKSRMMTPEAYRMEKMNAANGMVGEEEKAEGVAGIYEAYGQELARGNALDFDDLLLKGNELFKNHPRVVGKIKSVLIDEFQDTNTVQYDLVKLIARASGSLTIVGDPDQSIYGWRNAEIENLENMLEDFAPVKQVFLETNYRSTGAILGAALAVVRQDTKRINKSLLTSHPTGSSVVLHHAPSAPDEANFIASTIKHLIAHLGGLVSYKDCAVLLRYGALSRAVETAFQRSGVPCRMVGGKKFFERAEIKDLLSYLQLTSNPSYTPALLRVLNTPRRGLGDKTIREITSAAGRKKITAFEVCVRLANGGQEGLGLVKGITGAQVKGIRGLVRAVAEVRRRGDEGTDVASLIDLVCEKIQYRNHLDKTHTNDAAERWENVKELKTFATIVASENPPADLETALEELETRASQSQSQSQTQAEGGEGESQFEEVPIPDEGDSEDEIEILGDEEEGKIEVPLTSQTIAAESGQPTPLETFLATSMLATDVDTAGAEKGAGGGGEKEDDKVVISTCHAAKGLEWPVVFVPACEDGTYPFFRASGSNEVDEERRLLYVAITRAQSFCFLSYAQVRMAGADLKTKQLSPFLTTASSSYPTLFVKKLQKLTRKAREETAKVLGRVKADEEEVKRRVEEYNASQPVEPVIYDPKVHSTSTSNSRDYSSFGGRGRYGGGGGLSSGPFASQSQSQSMSQGRYSATSGFITASGQSLGKWSNPPPPPPPPSSSASQTLLLPVPAGEGGFRSALSTFRGPGSKGVTITTAGSSLTPPPSHAPPALPKPMIQTQSAFRPAGSRTLGPSSSSASASNISDSTAAAPHQPDDPNLGIAKTAARPVLPRPARPGAFKPPTRRNPPAASSSTSSSTSSSFSSAALQPTPYLRPTPPQPISALSPSSSSSSKKNDTEGPPQITETRSSLIKDAVLVNPTLHAPVKNPSKSLDLLESFRKGAGEELEGFRRFGGASGPGVGRGSESGGGNGEGEGQRKGKKREMEEIAIPTSEDLPDPASSLVVGGGGGGGGGSGKAKVTRPPQSPVKELGRGKRRRLASKKAAEAEVDGA